jgi:hypothetical protein
MAHLSTSHTLYLISFNGVSQQFMFNSDIETLGKLIAEHGKYGIIFIKQFQPHKGTFKNLSKKDITSWFDWDTYSIEQLKKVNCIK